MTFDFAIIGGGVAGLSAAARLAPLGKVIVLERESALAYHASGRSAALFEENYGAPSVNDLTRAGKDYFLNAHGGVLSERGILMVAQAGEEAQMATEAANFEMATITVDQACGLIPILDPAKFTHAAHSKAAKDIDTDLLIQNFARDCRASGGEIRVNAAVTTITKMPKGWQITSSGEVISARILVNAAGPWADVVANLAGIKPVGLQPFRRSIARVPAPDGLDVSNWPMLFGVGESWYAKPDAGQLIISPADEDPAPPHDAFADDETLATGIHRFSQVVSYEVTRMTANWAGLRTFAPDRTLVIGFAPDDPTFFWCAGQGGYGFQTSAGASALVRDLVGGQKPDLPAATTAALSPSRFQ